MHLCFMSQLDLLIPDKSFIPILINVFPTSSADESNDPGLDLLYADTPDLNMFSCECPSPELVSEWYKYTAREIEASSGFVDAALDLLKLAKEKNVKV